MSVVVMNNFSPRARFFSPSGTGKEDVFQPVFVKGDCRVLKKVGESDFYEIIQSFKEECSVKRIVERYQAGDLQALRRVQGLYIDVVDAPSSLVEAYETINGVKDAFTSLTPEAQAYYGDPLSFVQRVMVGDYPNSVVKDTEKEVVTNE